MQESVPSSSGTSDPKQLLTYFTFHREYGIWVVVDGALDPLSPVASG
jgi:hypothetical protein